MSPRKPDDKGKPEAKRPPEPAGQPAAGAAADPVAERKAAIRQTLNDLAALADEAGMKSTARDIREERLPKLDDERFSLVVLGEFNHGKSTFINALLGKPILPTGITPTTAVLAHLRHGPELAAELVRDSGARTPLAPAALADWLTVEGQSKQPKPPGGDQGADRLAYVEVAVPAPFLKDGVTVVDTPGVNDINEQRADITYGYIPRADAAVFLLDANQILTASERQFLEERILRSSRDRLVFVVTKADVLEGPELDQALAFARQHLTPIVPEAPLFAVSAKRALAGDAEGGRMAPLLAHLQTTLGADRRRLIHDHALADAGRLAGFLRQSLVMRRRSMALPVADLQERVTRAQDRLQAGRQALDDAAETIRSETAGLKARVRQDLTAFTEELAAALPRQIDAVSAPDVQRFLGAFVEDTWKNWLETEAEMLAGELESLAERVIQVASENAAEVTRQVADELGGERARLDINVDTFKYDASVFALGALGTTVFLFVNTLAGGLLALAAPVAAMLLKGRVAQEIKQEARQQAPDAVRRIGATLGPRLDELIDGFAARLSEFVAEAGAALARGIAEVLSGALAERRAREAGADGPPGAGDGDGAQAAAALEARLRAVEERIVDIRQRVWTPS
jgi:GTP-binding protein EngB required for normal cell division